MKKRIRELACSWQTTILLLILYSAGLAAATFIERGNSTQAASRWIYHNPLFWLLPLLMCVNFAAMVRYRWKAFRRRKGMLILHGGFILVLTGALVTHLFGYEGTMHIREGAGSDTIQTERGVRAVPFTVRLIDFRLTRYPGSHSPSSFESSLEITTAGETREETVSMNKVVYIDGFRLYQSSYDADEQGTVLSVNSDTAGTAVSYAGYLCLLAGMVVLLVERSGRFRVLGRKLKGLTAVLLLLSALDASAAAPDRAQLEREALPQSHIDRWERLLVQCPTGRIEPMDTYCRKILRKLSRADSYRGMDAEQVILGLTIKPQSWWSVPLIYQPNRELQRILGQQGDYISFDGLFDAHENYRIAARVDSAYAVPPQERSRFQKDLIKLDERANIIHMLLQGKLLALFPLPGDPAQKWYAPGDDLSRFRDKDSLFVAGIMNWYTEKPGEDVLNLMQVYQQKRSVSPLPSPGRISLEILYNRINPFFVASMGYMALGLLATLCALLVLTSRKKRLFSAVLKTLFALTGLLFLFHTAGIGIRWYISGQAPWSNAYESMIYVAWSTLLAGWLFARRSAVTLSLATFLGGVILLVAHMNWMDPEITPLVPVLKSYWLMIHVAVIVASYGFFAIGFLLGVFSLALMLPGRDAAVRKTLQELRIIHEMILQGGLCLMTAGTFLGAIWANESWGRYWGWDPKETWALITMLAYAVVLHARHIPRLRSDYAFSAMSVTGFASVLMTYFGVNYYLSGLHSYGGGETPAGIFVIFVVYGLLFLWMGYVKWRNYSYKKYK